MRLAIAMKCQLTGNSLLKSQLERHIRSDPEILSESRHLQFCFGVIEAEMVFENIGRFFFICPQPDDSISAELGRPHEIWASNLSVQASISTTTRAQLSKKWPHPEVSPRSFEYESQYIAPNQDITPPSSPTQPIPPTKLKPTSPELSTPTSISQLSTICCKKPPQTPQSSSSTPTVPA